MEGPLLSWKPCLLLHSYTPTSFQSDHSVALALTDEIPDDLSQSPHSEEWSLTALVTADVSCYQYTLYCYWLCFGYSWYLLLPAHLCCYWLWLLWLQLISLVTSTLVLLLTALVTDGISCYQYVCAVTDSDCFGSVSYTHLTLPTIDDV